MFSRSFCERVDTAAVTVVWSAKDVTVLWLWTDRKRKTSGVEVMQQRGERDRAPEAPTLVSAQSQLPPAGPPRSSEASSRPD